MLSRFGWAALFAVGLCVASAVPAGAQATYNMTVLKLVNGHPNANDCWGYTSPGGVELAIYGHSTGTAFVDATDPANAVEIWNLAGPSSGWRDIKTYLNYAYIVTEGSGTGTGLQIVDLTNPLSPVHVATYTANGFTTAHNIWIDEPAGIAYACGANGGTHILDLTNPAAPVEIDFFTAYYIHDLYVGNGFGYAGAISTGSLRIFDVSDPANPVTVASHFYGNASTHNAWPTADGTHCITTDEGGSNRVKIWNITNLTNIQLASEYIPSTEAAISHNGILKNDMMYVSHYKAGTRVVDLTDPTDPVEVGYYDTYPIGGTGFDGNWGVYPFRDDNVVYSSDRTFGLYILTFDGDFAGSIGGLVRDGTSTTPLAGASVTPLGGPLTMATDGAGDYSGRISGGTYSVVTSAFGYASDTSSVAVPASGSVVHDVDLAQVPSGTVDVTVMDAGTSNPLPGALVSVPGTPLTGNVSDGAGQVSLLLPTGTNWTVQVARFGHAVTTTTVSPSAGSTTALTVVVGRAFTDDFDVDQAWVSGAGDDNATDGLWERAVPIGSSFLGPVGADQDATPTGNGFAYTTENHLAGAFVGSSDVDNGKTTLLSPVFDASGFGDLTLNYQRWFSNRAPSPDNDEFRVDVSTDGGGSWTNLETLTVGTDAWAAVSLDLTAVVPATSAMQLRFVAEDINANTHVEGGVDDVEILTGATGVGALVETGPRLLELAAPAPNPFRDATVLSFSLPGSGPAVVEVFDVTGRRVAVLLSGERVASGTHRVTWDGTDDSGTRAAPGVYFARLTAGRESVSRKVVRVR